MPTLDQLVFLAERNSWQDLALCAGNIFVCFTLLPMLRHPARPAEDRVEFIAGLNLQRRRIAATPLLILMLIAGQHARAAETTGIITLSCEGTVRSGHGPGDVERVSERGIVVNLAEHTVTGFVTITGSALIANIVHVDDIRFEFTGGSASSSVFGTIDRVTGATTVHTTTWVTDKILGSKIIRGLSYYLVCKATNRLR